MLEFDLDTLLSLRVAVDALIVLAFWAQSRRYPGIGGPGWWAVASFLSILGSGGLWLRGTGSVFWAVVVGSTMLVVAALAVWWGLRSYLGLTAHRRHLLVAGLVCMATLALLTYGIDTAKGRQAVFSLAIIGITCGGLRDLLRAERESPRVPELRAVRVITTVELLTMLGFAVSVPVLGFTPDQVMPVYLFIFLTTLLVRMALYNALVSHRLRVEGDRARQALQVREADQRALIENLGAGVMVFRPDNTLASINTAARRFLGWSDGGANPALPEPTSGGHAWQLLGETGQPLRRHELPFDRVLATGQPARDIVMGVPVGEGGEIRWALCNAYPENSTDGGLRHVVLTFIDITSLRNAQAEQKTLQAQLAQSQKMEALGTLAGGVAHDFNNILAAILGNADLARQDLGAAHPSAESLDEIRTAARRGRELVRRILAFSRQQPMELVETDLAAVLAESCALLRAALPSHVELVQSSGGPAPRILADPTQIGQVFVNLGTNALHAMQAQGGRLEFRIDSLPAHHAGVPPELALICRQRQTGVVRVQVTDTGSGMDEAVRRRIFEPFFTTKAVGQGTGLGLPMVLGIVQSHGGAIDVQSRPGAGTTFTLLFPAAAPANRGTMPMPGRASAALPASAASAAPPPSTDARDTMPDATDAPMPHVLYLDDDDTLVFLVRRLLERRGFRVTAFTAQNDAIEAVRAAPGQFDLLLTDFNMPGMSGLEVARAVLAIEPSLTVAVASGYITDEMQAEARAAGVREVVFKTDAVETFCEVVSRLVQPAG
ncbi:hybrid sensor histidine kinase/response regulator [Hydrogenophaga sp. R2]|uniref:hybrid sensor histidine kinase/response regulator n=1 Tax=Hydrogenophaga sp. R2 TaxID=3132827 RepID=UPI003CF82E96